MKGEIKMSFSAIKKFLSKNYARICGNEKEYYIDKNGKVVATLQYTEDGKKLITLFIDDERGEINSHYNKVALAITNNINPQIKVDILVGIQNDSRITNGIISFYDNEELSNKSEKINPNVFSQYNLGAVGNIKLRNGKPELTFGKNRFEGIELVSKEKEAPTHLKAKKLKKCHK